MNKPLLQLACFVSCFIHAEETKKNVILIMADDMGYECVGANGSAYYKTPNLDKLAATGLRFEHCYSQPICTPSRVQIMTGRYNHRNYVKFGLLHPKEVTFGNVMKAAGYKTCIVGKWQLKGGFEGPTKFGFDEYCLWQLTRRPSRYANPGLEINGKAVDYPNGRYGPDIVSDYLVDFVKRHKDEPFFVWYPMILPHWPFEPTPDSADWDPKSKGLKGQGKPKYFPDMVAYVDKIIGKIVKNLEELGLRENTLVMFTGDNGTATSVTSPFKEMQWKGGKGSTRDAGTHVPFIANWPGTIKPKVSQDLIDFSDFLPTLAELGSATLPNVPIDGRSFLPLLRGEKGNPRDWIYCWYSRNGLRQPGKFKRFARNQRFKLYADGRFIDVPKDFHEQNELKIEEFPELAQGIKMQLQTVLDKTDKAEFVYADETAALQKANKKKKKKKTGKKKSAE
jgi:arylsulfatase A